MIYNRQLDLQKIYLVSNTRINHRCTLFKLSFNVYSCKSWIFAFSSVHVAFTKLPITSWHPSAEGCNIKCQRWAYTLSSVVLNVMNGLWNELRLYYLHAQRRCGWRVSIDYFTIFVNQELCEVPLDAIPENTTLAGLQELVYRCSTSTIYIDLK